MYRAISELYEQFPKATFKTYTVDRGKEFACYSKVEADLKVPVSSNPLSGKEEV